MGGLNELLQAWLATDESHTLGMLAARSGLSKSYLSRLSRGERQGIRPDTIRALSRGLRVPVDVVADAAGMAVVRVPAESFQDYVEMHPGLTRLQRTQLLRFWEALGVPDEPGPRR